MTFNHLLSIATGTVPLILAVGVGIGLKRYKYLGRDFKWLIVYLIICLLTDVSSRIIGELYDNNLIFIVLFSLMEVIFFYNYFKKYLRKNSVSLYGYATICAVIYIVYELYSLKDVAPAVFQPYSKVISSFLIISMALNCLFETMKEEQRVHSSIMLNGLFVIYFSLNLILFLPVNFLINVPSSVKFYFWCANFVVTLSFYTYLSILIWKNGSTQKRLRHGLQ